MSINIFRLVSDLQRDCLYRFLDEYGVLIYRSPLTEVDKIKLFTVFQEGLKTSYAQGLHLVIQSLFESPRFIYRIEHGIPAKNNERYSLLSPYEHAARLSFVLWNQGPDRELIQSVSSGDFETEQGYQKQLDRLLQDQRADEAFIDFARSWLGIQSQVDKDHDVFTDWSDDVLSAMNAQTDQYLKSILLGANHNVNSFFQHSHKDYAPEALKQWYHHSSDSAGILSLPLLLSNHSKSYETFPIARGIFMLEKILCIQLPDPPADVGELPPFSQFANNRERFAAHTANPECQGCHSLIDPLGFAFEHFDAIGQFRLQEKGQAIDASGQLSGVDVSGSFTNLPDLAKKLNSSQDVKQCITRHWFRYAMQRRELQDDACSLSMMLKGFSASNYKFSELRKSILSTPAFTHMRPIEEDQTSPSEKPEQSSENPENDNLVQNGDFNQGADGWSLRGEGVIKLPNEDNFVFHPQDNNASIRQTITLKPNTDYQMSIMINALPGSEGPVVVDTSDRFDTSAQIVHRTSTEGWTKFTSSFNSGTFTDVTIRLFVEDNFSGTVYFDDVQLKKSK